MSDNNATGRQLVLALKHSAGLPGPPLLIPVGQPPVAWLRPVATRAGLLEPADVQVLTEWRNRFVHAFLTEFEATTARTALWLTDHVGPNEGKILFMVDDPMGRTFAYVGLDQIRWEESRGEADAIVRGGEAPPGTMQQALTTLLEWAQGSLGLMTLMVRVRSDNPALHFYHKVGFEEQFRIPLRQIVAPGMTRWVEDKAATGAAVQLVHLRWGGRKKR
jgi:hypothetical protein